MNDAVYETLIKLCIDICRRNGKKKLLWFGDKNKTLNYSPKADEMVITVHRWFASKSCPGDWLYSRLGDLAKKVTAELSGDDEEDDTDIDKGLVRCLPRIRRRQESLHLFPSHSSSWSLDTQRVSWRSRPTTASG